MIPGGKVLGPKPNLVNPTNVIAEKVANLASPASANTMWDKLASKQNASPPMSGGLTASTPGTYGTSRLQHLSTQLTAGQDRYKDPLPHLAGKPKQGIGSAMQEVAGGKGSGLQAGNTVFVDDKNFPVTLSEIIGSRMLTAEQLQKASIQNVKKLFNVGMNSTNHKGSSSVGTKEENEELYYMAQRMMIEGFIRGVDITKELEAQGGLNIAIRNVSYNANPNNNIGLNASGPGMDSINFNAKFWRNASEAERYTLFLHELGHGLLDRPELGTSARDDIMGPGPTTIAKRLMTSKAVYNSILDDHFRSATNKGTIAISKIQAGQGTSTFDPSWFPQLSGEQISTGGPNYQVQDPVQVPMDYNSQFNSLNANFAKLAEMMTAQSAAQNQYMQEQQIMGILDNMPAPQAQANTIDNSSNTAVQAAAGTSAVIQAGGAYDTTGFAQQLANLEGPGTIDAGNLLQSG